MICIGQPTPQTFEFFLHERIGDVFYRFGRQMQEIQRHDFDSAALYAELGRESMRNLAPYLQAIDCFGDRLASAFAVIDVASRRIDHGNRRRGV